MDTAAKKTTEPRRRPRTTPRRRSRNRRSHRRYERGATLSSAAPRFCLIRSSAIRRATRMRASTSGTPPRTPSSGRTGGSQPSSRRARSEVNGLSRDEEVQRTSPSAIERDSPAISGAMRPNAPNAPARRLRGTEHASAAASRAPRPRAGRTRAHVTSKSLARLYARPPAASCVAARTMPSATFAACTIGERVASASAMTGATPRRSSFARRAARTAGRARRR